MFPWYDNPSSPGHLNKVGETFIWNGKPCAPVPRKRDVELENKKTKTTNSSGSSGKSFCSLGPFVSACESFNRKKHGLTQREGALSVPAEVLAWCGLFTPHAPCFRLSSFLTVEKQEGILLMTWATLKTTSDFDLFLGVENGSGIKEQFLVRLRSRWEERPLWNELTTSIWHGPR